MKVVVLNLNTRKGDSVYNIGQRSLKKKFRASTGFEPVTSTNTGAMYEATHWEPGGKKDKSHKNDLAPNVWLHSLSS